MTSVQGKNVMAEVEYVEVVAGILWREDQYLATQRPLHKVHGGFWEFPGGKVEAGESLQDALIRELWEELAVRVRQCRYWQTVEHHYAEKSVRVHFFHVHDFSGEPRGLEGQNMQWILPEHGVHMDFLEADKNLIHALYSLYKRHGTALDI